MTFDKAEITERCDEFYSIYDITRDRVRDMCKQKHIHTKAVAENCVYIAKHFGLSDYDCALAWVIGELHDFARFGQAVVTKTFRDSDLYNHARLGARLLFHHKMIEDIISNYNEISDTDKIVIEKAIYHHSDFHLPDNLSQRERMFCEIIREADQIDIFRTIATSSWTTIYGHSKEEVLASDISAEILAAFPKHELADYSKRVYFGDYHLAHIALGFGLKSAAARQRAVEQGYLWKLVDVEFTNSEVQAKYLVAKNCVEEVFQFPK